MGLQLVMYRAEEETDPVEGDHQLLGALSPHLRCEPIFAGAIFRCYTERDSASSALPLLIEPTDVDVVDCPTVV